MRHPSLMTVHTSELGERLAQKYVKEGPETYEGEVDPEHANWWLDAIAAEIEHDATNHSRGFTSRDEQLVDAVVKWLRGGRDD